MNETYDPMASKTGLKPRMSTDLEWEKVSNENHPWYLPIPEAPTPPKGRDSTINTINKIYFIIGIKIIQFMTDSRDEW